MKDCYQFLLLTGIYTIFVGIIVYLHMILISLAKNLKKRSITVGSTIIATIVIAVGTMCYTQNVAKVNSAMDCLFLTVGDFVTEYILQK